MYIEQLFHSDFLNKIIALSGNLIIQFSTYLLPFLCIKSILDQFLAKLKKGVREKELKENFTCTLWSSEGLNL